MSSMLRVRRCDVRFPVRRGLLRRRVGWLLAVDGVSFELGVGEVLGLVGESGCGKTTLIRALARLQDLHQGSIEFGGQEVSRLGGAALRAWRTEVQMVFQDAHSALDPRRSVFENVVEGLVIHRLAPTAEREDRVAEVLRRVGLDPALGARFPHQCSGGQRQRIALARALVLDPRLLLLDEPLAALDVRTQAGVIDLITGLCDEGTRSVVFVTHDLGVVRHLCDRVAVMDQGRWVESGPTEAVFEDPRHPATRSLLEARPSFGGPRLQSPSLLLETRGPRESGEGCPLHPRCPVAESRCATEDPPDRMEGNRRYRCIHDPPDSS